MKRAVLWMLLLTLWLVPAARAAQIPYLSEVDSAYSSVKDVLEACAVDLHQTASCGGASITIDQLCLSEDYILVFFTARSDKALSLPDEAGDPESWRYRWAAPTFFAIPPDGSHLRLGSGFVKEAFMPDERTIRGCARIEIQSGHSGRRGLRGRRRQHGRRAVPVEAGGRPRVVRGNPV
jgi:hypothetical protein